MWNKGYRVEKTNVQHDQTNVWTLMTVVVNWKSLPS